MRYGVIAYVGTGNHILVGEHTEAVDAKGRFLVPGFIDTHDHDKSSMV